jgi:hypothetical protein
MSIVVEENRLQDAAEVMDTLVVRTAANDDLMATECADTALDQKAAPAASGWSAYDVWRRLIKEARDRRELRGGATRR